MSPSRDVTTAIKYCGTWRRSLHSAIQRTGYASPVSTNRIGASKIRGTASRSLRRKRNDWRYRLTPELKSARTTRWSFSSCAAILLLPQLPRLP